MKTTVLAAMVLLAGFAGVASGNVLVTIDENGNGYIANYGPVGSFVGQDSGPGGFPNALLYQFVFTFVPGDLILDEPQPPFGIGQPSDLVRFNQDLTIAFYSDNSEGSDALADLGFPLSNYPNLIHASEQGVEGGNSYVYTPGPSDPGFVPGAAEPFTYIIISDVPEPATMTLLALGLGAMLLRRRMK